MISQFVGEEAREKANLNTGEQGSKKPVLVYVTTSDAKEFKRIKTWEESRLADDKLIAAVKLFQCYTIDQHNIPTDHEFLTIIKKSKAPSFLVVSKGDVAFSSGQKPSTSKILAVLKKGASKFLGVSMDKIVKKGLDLQKEMDKLKAAKDEVDKKLKALKEKDRRRVKYEKERAELVDQENKLKQEQEVLYNVKPKEIAKK